MSTQPENLYQGVEEQYKKRKLPCPADIHHAVEQFFGIEDFVNDSYLPYLNEIEVRLHELALQQFPSFQNFPDARADHWVRMTHCWYSGNNVLFSAAELVREQADGLVPADTYGDELERLRKAHVQGEGPRAITDDCRDPVMYADDDAWEE